MRYYGLFIASFVLTLFAGCSTSPQQSTVNFSVTGAEGQELILVQRPYGQAAPGYGFTDTLILENGRTAAIELSLDKISSMNIAYAGGENSILLEPGKTYNISFDYSDPENYEMNIDDDAVQAYADLQKTRNIFLSENTEYVSALPVMDGYKMFDYFEETIRKDKALFSEIEMSPRLRKAIGKEVEMYWMAILSNIFRNDYYMNISQEEGAPVSVNNGEAWDKIYKKYPVSDDYIPYEWLYIYAKTYIINYIPAKGNVMSEEVTAYSFLEEKYGNVDRYIKKKGVREEVTARFLLADYEISQNSDPILRPYMQKFVEDYPDSPYNTLFPGYIRAIDDYQTVIAGEFSGDVKFVEEYNTLMSFKDVLAKFKGKPVFVDFWFSSCVPCLEQFGYGKPLKDFLKSNGIEMLYISVDAVSQEVEWGNAIKYYGLAGWHVRTNVRLRTDLQSNYGVESFPRYMIVDANGNIAVDDAKRPSEGEELFEQIKTALKLQ